MQQKNVNIILTVNCCMEKAPGLSGFQYQDANVFRTYCTYSAGLGDLGLVYSLFDLTSTGRYEKNKPNVVG